MGETIDENRDAPDHAKPVARSVVEITWKARR